MSRQKRVLFVSLHNSIHTARWIELIAPNNWDLHLFPFSDAEHHPKLRYVTMHRPDIAPPPAITPPPPAPEEPPSGLRRTLSRIKTAIRNPRYAARRLWDRFGAAPAAPAPVAAPPAAEPVTSPPVAEDPSALRIQAFRPTPVELAGHSVTPGKQIRLGESDVMAAEEYGPAVLAALIRRLKPDLVHSMVFQAGGYPVLAAKDLYGEGFPPWLATNWGSDIYYFRRFDDHRAQIQRLLAAADYYSCECHRDVTLARQLGFKGLALPVYPVSGGFDMAHLDSLRSPGPTSRRRLLMIKGYEHFAGRAMTSLKVLTRFADRLKDYEIVLFSVSAEPRKTALELAEKGVLNIRVIDAGTHDEILGCFGRARLYMGISISDAISTSVLESMSMGAFPIQTNTSCCDEWFEDGVGGFIVPPDDLEVICDRFIRAIEDDELVDRAAELNRKAAMARLDERVLGPQIAAFYQQVWDSLA